MVVVVPGAPSVRMSPAAGGTRGCASLDTTRGLRPRGSSTLCTAREAQEHAVQLAPGMRVHYTARSHRCEYKAVVMGREPGRQAWRIRVECGGEKIVEDSEIWRLKPAVKQET